MKSRALRIEGGEVVNGAGVSACFASPLEIRLRIKFGTKFKTKLGGSLLLRGGLVRAVAFAILLLGANLSRGADTLISTGAVWKYFDATNDLGTAWRDLSYNDSGWSNGVAQLGFGDGDEGTIVRSNRQATTYFRRTFNVDDPSIYTNLWLRLLRDDGGVVYLNGTEVFRSNMPLGPITNGTLASTSVPANDETTNFYPQVANPALLVAGSNIVAAEIHQNSLTSSDLSFDLLFVGNVLDAPPVVAITNIANNRFFKFGTNILIAASATDIDDPISRVEFFVGGTNKLGEDTSSPYSVTWSNVALGSYTFTAIATDARAFSSTSAPVNIFVVTNLPPVVNISSPTNQAGFKPGTNITISATATDTDNSVAKVEFYANDEKLGEDTSSPYSFVWSNVVAGEYALAAVGIDNFGITATSIVNVLVASNLPPAVNLFSPTNNTVLGGPLDITLRATASDSDGSIARVEFYERQPEGGGEVKVAEDTTVPYSIIWSNVTVGSYILTAIAIDNGGASRTSAPVNIHVRANASPTVNITAPTNNAFVKVGTNVTIAASASDSDGTVAQIEFFQDNQKIGQVSGGVGSVVASNLQEGVYVFRAIATDNLGASSTSAPINVICVTNFRPSVALTSPANNTSYGGPLDVIASATASDRDGSIVVVEFFEGENKLGEDTTTPYSVTWSNAPVGVYTLTAVSHDNLGLTATSAPVAVTIKTNVAPSVALSAPTNGAAIRIPALITVTATATDTDGGIRRVEFFADLAGSEAQRLGEKTNAPYTMTWSNALEGAYVLTAIATDIAGESRTSAPVNVVLVTNFVPTVSITAPTNNTVRGGPLDVSIVATAADADGSIAKLELFAATSGLDPVKLSEVAGPTNQYVWTNVTVGDYVLTAVATDSVGVSRTSAPIALIIHTNVAPTVSITNPRNNSVFNLLSNVVITASSTDSDGFVRRVEFFATDNATSSRLRIGEVTNSPYTLTWSNIAKGLQILSAVASDNIGAMRTSAPIRISVLSNIPPSIAITNPLNNSIHTAKMPLDIQIRASDPDGTVAKVELFQSEYKIAEWSSPPFNYTVSNYYAGTYTFRARVTDSYGDSVFSDAVSVTLHNRRLLVPQGSEWRYLDNGVDQSNTWRSLAFNDHSWTNGRAQFGFGDGDEATVVNGGPTSNRFTTIYFRHTFSVTNRDSFSNVFVRLLRDDGGVVYLNGYEVFRSNISTNATNEIFYSTIAPAGATADEETTTFLQTTVSVTNLVEGSNVVAVEIHQNSTTSSDLSFDLELSAADRIGISRGPYLQSGTPTSLIVRWRTDGPLDSRVRLGTNREALDLVVDDATPTNEHIIQLTGLAPDTRYYYTIGSTTEILAGGLDYTFSTAPLPVDFNSSTKSRPVHIWVLGDSGTGDANARSVRDAYYDFAKDRPIDLWLMLGDNAYDNGTEEEFQNALFDMYPVTLRQSVLWPIISNHDVANLTNAPLTMNYFQFFSLPTDGVAGGVPSGTERYYSFDYGNIHFVCLDSQTSQVDPESQQYEWLARDLAANRKNWLIATCANPPYGKIGNNTDTMPRDLAVRTHLLPLLEAHGLDLYFAGDDHAWERSFLLDSHYGLSATLTNSMILDGGSGQPEDTGAYDKHARGPVPHRGAVYVVNGSSGHLDTAGPGHPANYITRVVLGSAILDVDDTQLKVQFLTSSGSIDDYFVIVKSNSAPVVQNSTLITAEDTPAPLTLLASDPEGDRLTYHITATPTNGIVQLLDQSAGVMTVVTNGGSFSNATLVYVPNPDFNGLDSLTFTVDDGSVASAPGTVAITVTSQNDKPAAIAQSLSTPEDNAVSVQLIATDMDGDSIEFRVGSPAHGTISGTPPSLTYQPAKDYFGPDSFSFTVYDGQLESEAATVTVQVLPVNDPPVARALAVPPSPIAPDNAFARVVLDGSLSSDKENDPLHFYWSENGAPLSAERIASVNLAVGPHLILLRVADGTEEGRTEIQVQVGTAAQAVDQISQDVANSSLPLKNKRPLQATLAASMAGFDRMSQEAAINELGAFISKVRAQVAPTDPALAERLTRKAQHIIDVMTAALDKPHLHSLTAESNRAMRLRFSGAPAGQIYLVQASSDLVTWENIGVIESQPDSVLEFTDAEAAALSQRFYRLARP